MTNTETRLAAPTSTAKSVTPAGVWMTATPSQGLPDESLEQAGVFRAGVVTETRELIIDYADWPDWTDGETVLSYKHLGQVLTHQYLVRDQTGRTGWVSEGSIIIKPAVNKHDEKDSL